ncbi:MAG: hypothetical protein Q7W45_07920 [Bacteroidota bacterium]|nr:hypothetical protein [Bacteroidota bacterium]MDP3145979.1 hypothetical protein [Bacteroidota bacterium]
MTSNTNSLAGGNDLSAKIDQTAADKLINSVKFPLTLVSLSTPPPGILLTEEVANDNEIILKAERVKELLDAFAKASLTNIQSTSEIPDDETKFNLEALGNISETIESAKACLRAMEAPQTPTTAGQLFSFPDKAYLEAIVNGGVEGLLETTKGLELKAICSDLRVIADNIPNLGLNGTKVSISNSKITVKATGQLWARIPSFHCSRWCTRWTISWRWVRLASVSVSVTVDLDAYIEILPKGKILNARAHINNLRLAYPILKEIPLEKIANSQLEDKLIPIFDAGSFIACVPVVNSRFGIESISIPNVAGSIQIDIAIKQV